MSAQPYRKFAWVLQSLLDPDWLAPDPEMHTRIGKYLFVGRGFIGRHIYWLTYSLDLLEIIVSLPYDQNGNKLNFAEPGTAQSQLIFSLNHRLFISPQCLYTTPSRLYLLSKNIKNFKILKNI